MLQLLNGFPVPPKVYIFLDFLDLIAGTAQKVSLYDIRGRLS